MFECAMNIDGGEGVLLIIKNYTGDILNFETATELLHESGVKVTTVVVDDDVAVKDSLYTAGRRGVANTVLIEKLVGAAAERGDSLEACAELGRKQQPRPLHRHRARRLHRTGRRTTLFELQDNEMEFGVGIHGEPGIDRRRFSSLDRTVDEMFDTLLENGAYSRTLRQWDTVKGAWQEVTQSKQALQKATGLSRWSITSAPPAVRTVRRVQPSGQRCEGPASSSNATSSAATVPRWIWWASPSLC
jgi:dihydroxyacetone kinase-like protein